MATPFQVLGVIFGERLLTAWHTLSSFDPYGDSFDILFRYIGLLGCLALLSAVLFLWLALRALVNPPD